MQFLKNNTLDELEKDVFKAKSVLFAHDIPKVLWG